MSFQDFYSLYPRKMARKDAERAWNRLTPIQQAECLEALPNYLKYWKIKETQKDYIPYPASWINAARWEDVLDMTPAKEKVDRSWMFSQQGIENKARELGILGNGYDSYETLKKKCMMRMGMEIE